MQLTPSLPKLGYRTNGRYDCGKHHDPQPRRRCEDPLVDAGGGQRPIHGREYVADPARHRRAEADFSEPHEHITCIFIDAVWCEKAAEARSALVESPK